MTFCPDCRAQFPDMVSVREHWMDTHSPPHKMIGLGARKGSDLSLHAILSPETISQVTRFAWAAFDAADAQIRWFGPSEYALWEFPGGYAVGPLDTRIERMKYTLNQLGDVLDQLSEWKPPIEIPYGDESIHLDGMDADGIIAAGDMKREHFEQIHEWLWRTPHFGGVWLWWSDYDLTQFPLNDPDVEYMLAIRVLTDIRERTSHDKPLVESSWRRYMSTRTRGPLSSEQLDAETKNPLRMR